MPNLTLRQMYIPNVLGDNTSTSVVMEKLLVANECVEYCFTQVHTGTMEAAVMSRIDRHVSLRTTANKRMSSFAMVTVPIVSKM